MAYQDELTYLYTLQQFGIKLGLSNIRKLCSHLNDPQEKIKTVHVGGTNGKGSTAAVISSILQESGYRAGLYTSPHLVDFTERIRINNIPITHDRACRLIGKIRRCIADEDIAPTFFEFTTALALLYFAEEDVDIAVIEVGMGGRLDATNIINPLVSIITNVEYDHTEHLGPTLEDIAREKCGIFKRGVPVVASEEKGHILSIIEGYAKEAGSAVYVHGRDFHAAPVRLNRYYSESYYDGLKWKRILLKSPLSGRHQILNIADALCTAELLSEQGFGITAQQASEGVRNVSWPGRLEMLPGNPQILLDGAHNHAGAMALRNFIEDVLMGGEDQGKIILIFGVLRDKDVHSMIGELMPYPADVIITRPDTERGLPVEELRVIVESYGIKPHVTPNVSEALSLAYGIASSSDFIVVTGSLYLVGEARAQIKINKQFS